MCGIQKNKSIRLKGKKLDELIKKVLERDNWECQGVDCPGGFRLDRPHHIKFKSQGGPDTMDNLTTLCRFCHAAKHGIKIIV